MSSPLSIILRTSECLLHNYQFSNANFVISSQNGHLATAIHPDKKTVSVKNLETGGEFEESYDKLILSPGAKPAQPRLPGIGLDRLFTLRTVEDTFRIKDYINKHHPKSAVLAGGGFISLELAENLRELGMDVTIVQRPKQLMNPFDADMAAFIHNEMRKHGVRLSPMNHAGYYPGSKVMTMKVVFEKETYRLPGAQIVGYDGVDKRIDSFLNIPVDELRDRLDEVKKGKPVYVICQSGLRSYIASRILEGNGYEVYNFSGGFRFYDAVMNDRALNSI